MTYTAAQYAAQDRIMVQIRWSNATGLCPVCRTAPLATWPDGVRRATCAAPACHARWLNIRPPAPAAPAASTASATDQFPVTIAGVTDHA